MHKPFLALIALVVCFENRALSESEMDNDIAAIYFVNELNDSTKIDRINSGELLRCEPQAVSIDGVWYYSDLWSMNRDIVRRCARQTKIGVQKRVRGTYEEVCTEDTPGKADRKWMGKYDFALSRRDDGIHVAQKIRFDLRPTETVTKAKMLAFLERCMVEVKQFWFRNGIIFDLSYDTTDAVKTNSHVPLHKMTIHGAKDTEWGVATSTNAENLYLTDSEDMNCRTFLHEHAHSLGLQDQYRVTGCDESKRNIDGYNGKSINFMARFYSSTPTTMRDLVVAPADLMKLISPICGR